MKIYISGPMSGIRNMNYPAFEAAEQMLLDDGWDVVSPHRAPRKESRDTHVKPLRCAYCGDLLSLAEARPVYEDDEEVILCDKCYEHLYGKHTRESSDEEPIIIPF